MTSTSNASRVRQALATFVLVAGLLLASAGTAAAQVQEGHKACSGQTSRGALTTNTGGPTYLRAPGGTKTTYWATGGWHTQAATSLYNMPILGGGTWRAQANTIYSSNPHCTIP